MAELELPVIGLPLTWVETPWKLLFLGHEVGHKIQLDLVQGLVPEFGGLLAAAAGDQPAALRWKMWSQEIFADLSLP